ncbi:MAG: hypothetical protein M1826_002383 [Phylliscum demangeonii]|nr:MAG: hypothetical protein M1826_002383 [Phylliscum demangeonii]
MPRAPIGGESSVEAINHFLADLHQEANGAVGASSARYKWGPGFGLAAHAAKAARQAGTLYMVASAPNQIWEKSQLYQSGEWDKEDKEAYKDGEGEWHCFGVFFAQRTMWIYDPSYVHPSPPSPPIIPEASEERDSAGEPLASTSAAASAVTKAP